MPLDVPGCTRATMIVAESICSYLIYFTLVCCIGIYTLLYIYYLSRKYDRQSIPSNNLSLLAQVKGSIVIVYLYTLTYFRAPIEFVVGTDHCVIFGLGLN